jgi:hypothetical protein
VNKTKISNESHIMLYGNGVYLLDENGVLWREDVKVNKARSFAHLMNILGLKIIAKVWIRIK